MTAKHLRALFPSLGALAIAGYVLPLNAALREFAITTGARVTAFLAQVGHESADLRTWHELWGPTPQQVLYEPPSKLADDLGNTEPGDGFKYRGRGPIQITGRGNYARTGAVLGVDLAAQPELLEKPDVGFRAAGLFWLSRELNNFADRETVDSFKWITRRINGAATDGPPSHHLERARRLREARAVFGLTPIPGLA